MEDFKKHNKEVLDRIHNATSVEEGVTVLGTALVADARATVKKLTDAIDKFEKELPTTAKAVAANVK